MQSGQNTGFEHVDSQKNRFHFQCLAKENIFKILKTAKFPEINNYIHVLISHPYTF
jgi:hypothetical protein